MRDDRLRREGGEGPRRLAEEPRRSNMARLLAAAARPVAVPRGARERVLARLSGARPARRWGWRLAVAGGALAAFALVWWVVRARGEAPLARVAASEGEVRIVGGVAGAAAQVAGVGASVADGATLATGAGGRARLELADVVLGVGTATRARMGRGASGGVDIGLEHGEIDLTVDPRPTARAVVVHARGHSVTVVGTVFRVRAPVEGGVAVEVSEGAVQVRGPAVARVLRAGESWSSAAAAAAVAPLPSPPVGERVSSSRRGERETPLPRAAARPSRTAAVAPAPPRVEADEGRSNVAPREQGAAATPRAVVDGGLGDPALFARGLALLRQTGDPEAARAAFLEHRRRFPGSSLRVDVELSLIEASLAAGRLDEASREIDQFLAREPQSERRDELLLTRANLARDAGDCARAARDYQRLIPRGGRVGEEALYFSAYCRRRMGDLAGARQQLREYLDRFPGGRHRQDVERSLAAPAKKL